MYFEVYRGTIRSEIYTYRASVQFVAQFLGQGITMAEIGVHRGNHAFELAYLLSPKKFILVDTWDEPGDENNTKCDENDLEAAKLNMHRFNNIEFIRKKSLDASLDYPDGFFDFVYIDANHDKLLEDIVVWYPKVRQYGVLAGHDVNYPGVRKALSDFKCAEDILHENNDWWLVKK